MSKKQKRFQELYSIFVFCKRVAELNPRFIIFSMENLVIREATKDDLPVLYSLFKTIVEEQASYPFTLPFSYSDFIQFWEVPSPSWKFCACIGDTITGGYMLKPNSVGLGDHVANGSFFVAPPFRRRGIGEQLGGHALKKAKELHFLALQFNYVVSTNVPAVNLWLKLGFKIVGSIPKAFRHPQKGYVDVYIMFREIES
ncbi:GNAT family N-acetyltransferase [Candidatus Methylacidiphilum infernorum]|uniref:GNAT family N-acetyltransferase n=2 Tax=Candidatus Methylacidiphilum infernorum TaxID=511746 RepID=A0ABX7PXH2_9BACT|nr:GNAT family N-acetyltransferase [Candidatus Methylacidiphilum infernorum]